MYFNMYWNHIRFIDRKPRSFRQSGQSISGRYKTRNGTEPEGIHVIYLCGTMGEDDFVLLGSPARSVEGDLVLLDSSQFLAHEVIVTSDSDSGPA